MDGDPQGRNQLIEDAILQETGEVRDRKQLSSHIQVLRPKGGGTAHMYVLLRLFCVKADQIVLRYMPQAEKDKDKKKKMRSGATSPGASRSRHGSSTPVKHKHSQHQMGGHNMLYHFTHPEYATEVPFTIMHFDMLVQDGNKRPVYHVTQLSSHSRLSDLHFTDPKTWRKRYVELKFHQPQKWKERQVLVCDASINLMHKQPLYAELAIAYVIDAHHDLSISESLSCRTRFYDHKEEAYEETRQCEYATPFSRKLHFGSKFWVGRMSELQMDLHKARRQEDPREERLLETRVQRSLQYMTAMTAVQNIYGTKYETGDQHCFLTILWRFSQTRTPAEPGKATWRVANFRPPVHQTWIKDEPFDTPKEQRPLDDHIAPRCSHISVPQARAPATLLESPSPPRPRRPRKHASRRHGRLLQFPLCDGPKHGYGFLAGALAAQSHALAGHACGPLTGLCGPGRY